MTIIKAEISTQLFKAHQVEYKKAKLYKTEYPTTSIVQRLKKVVSPSFIF